ncbi:hypothetical protein [Streptomyces sp. NPDC003952]
MLSFSAVARPLTCLLAPAGLALAMVAPAQAADVTVPLITCSGAHTVNFDEPLDDTAYLHHGNAEFNDGTANLVENLAGNTSCKPKPGSTTPVSTYQGVTVNINFQQTVSCTQTGANDGTFTGTAKWRNAAGVVTATNTLVNGQFLLEEGEHGNSIVKLRSTVQGGAFNGRTLDILANGKTNLPNACETDGIKKLTGSHSIEVY